MRNIQVWNPFKELEAMQNRLSSVFGGDMKAWSDMDKPSFYPAVDISEDKEAYRFKMDLPEMKKDDIKVECHDGVLTISGEKRFEKETKNDEKKFHRLERSYGSFMRSFTLPEEASTDMVNAEYKEGVLDIKIAKKALGAPSKKTIPVN